MTGKDDTLISTQDDLPGSDWRLRPRPDISPVESWQCPGGSNAPGIGAIGPEEPRPQGQARPRLLAPLPPVRVPVLHAPVAAPAGHHYTCKEIGRYTTANQLMRQGHTYLDRKGDGIACESFKY